MWLERRQDETEIARSVWMPSGDADVSSPYVGRAELRLVSLASGDTGVVRRYQHGGLFRFWTREWFVSRPPRPLVELAATETARQRGVLTLDILAAVVAYDWGPFYRGWLVTRELQDAEDLWRAVGARASAFNGLLMARVGEAVRFMHEAGLYHTDLNLRNLLVDRDRKQIFVIDFDKAQVFEQAVSPALRRRNVARLLRSIRKLDPARQHVSEEDWQSFLAAYHE